VPEFFLTLQSEKSNLSSDEMIADFVCERLPWVKLPFRPIAQSDIRITMMKALIRNADLRRTHFQVRYGTVFQFG
jgi:hypothetical protein